MHLPPVPLSLQVPLPNGCTLYMDTDASGFRSYYTDEVGGGAHVWNPALVSPSTLLVAIIEEERIQKLEAERARRAKESASA